MKTIEEKAKAYDEAIGKAAALYKASEPMSGCNVILETLFPELKESQNHQDSGHPNGCIVLEDFNGGDGFYKVNLDYLNKKQIEEIEKMVKVWNKESKTSNENIIKACIGMCLTDADEQRFKDYNTSLKDCLDWLKKQGEKPMQGKQKPVIEFKTAEESLGVDSDTYNKIVDECIFGEQKPNDKVEPKFQNGQWIVWQNKCYKVNYNGCGYELIDQNGLSTSLEYETIDGNARLWDITKDAKSGDLIYVSTEEKGIQAIFDKFDGGIIYFHCSLCRDFTQGGYMPMGDVEFVFPLQKTHYQRFFQKMHEAGYEWDAEKKELKLLITNGGDFCESENCEQKPAWSEEDKDMIRYIGNAITCNESAKYLQEKGVDIIKAHRWLKSLRPQTKKEWDEADKEYRDAAIYYLRSYCNPYKVKPILEWLEELGPKSYWKPSDEQMKYLRFYSEQNNYDGTILTSLYNDLKKLKEGKV